MQERPLKRALFLFALPSQALRLALSVMPLCGMTAPTFTGELSSGARLRGLLGKAPERSPPRKTPVKLRLGVDRVGRARYNQN